MFVLCAETELVMRVLIVGAAGMLGQRLALQIAQSGKIGERPVSAMLLADRVFPAPIAGTIHSERLTVDISLPESVANLMNWRPDVVFHLAAIVSSDAESNFDKGYKINVEATWSILETMKRLELNSRFVFASSLAVFGEPFPEVVPDDFHLTPRSSYGSQKAICEFLVSDYSRKGYVDGVSFRFPTIVVRPGSPNAAASGFLSSIIREPLKGIKAKLPVSLDTRAWIASPSVAINSLLHAACLPSGSIAKCRSISGRGISVSAAEMIQALRDLAGSDVIALIEPSQDSEVERIVSSWPRAFSADHARELGFPVDTSIHEIISTHIAENPTEPQALAATP